ncbi:MAG: DUF177 domain-containing protein [Alphaproteobacteria bacterium]
MPEKGKEILETEWSYWLDVESLEGEQSTFSLTPDEAARARLAQRLGVVSLDALRADITVSRGAGEAAFHVTGHLDAEVTQECVVTLEPIAAHIEDDFEAWFADPAAAVSIAKARHEKLNEKGHGELPVLDERDDPEVLVEGKIDLGELVTQYLSLSINPYPHAEGAVFEAPQEKNSAEGDDLVKNPFAALKDWKDKLGGGENS